MSMRFKLLGADGPVLIRHLAKPRATLYAHDLVGVIADLTNLGVLDASYRRLVAQGLLEEASDIVVLPAPRSVAVRHKYRLTDIGRQVAYRSLASGPRQSATKLGTNAVSPIPHATDWFARAADFLAMREPVFAC